MLSEESQLRTSMWAAEDFHARKAARKAYFEKFVKGWKQVPCGACNGVGKYDNMVRRHGKWHQPDCSCCDGTGKERVSPEEYQRRMEIERQING